MPVCVTCTCASTRLAIYPSVYLSLSYLIPLIYLSTYLPIYLSVLLLPCTHMRTHTHTHTRTHAHVCLQVYMHEHERVFASISYRPAYMHQCVQGRCTGKASRPVRSTAYIANGMWHQWTRVNQCVGISQA